MFRLRARRPSPGGSSPEATMLEQVASYLICPSGPTFVPEEMACSCICIQLLTWLTSVSLQNLE